MIGGISNRGDVESIRDVIRQVRASGKDLDWFKRDPVHANSRGEAVLGRILLAYFSPKGR